MATPDQGWPRKGGPASGAIGGRRLGALDCRSVMVRVRSGGVEGGIDGGCRHQAWPAAAPLSKRPTIRPRSRTIERSLMPAISSTSEESTSTARPRSASAAELEIDLAAGADIDAARRLLEDEERDAVDQPARDADLLLVAAGERAHRSARARACGCREDRSSASPAPSPRPSTRRGRGRSAPGTGATMFSRTVRSPMMPSLLAVGGDEADAGAPCRRAPSAGR